MPRSLTTERTLQEAARLSFCYLCGQVFAAGDDINRDHVPPSGLFAQADRMPPLILRTHQLCNVRRSSEDQAIGQLVGVLHGRRVNPRHNKLRMLTGGLSGGSFQILATQIDVKAAIRRWVRGFHAALYHEYLSEDSDFATYPPMPEGTHSDGRVVYNPVSEIVPKFVEELRRNRAVFNIDRIISRNAKCRYECVWSQADDGRWICIYGLDLYNWSDLGDRSQPSRGCVGCYRRQSGGTPPEGSTGTRLTFNVTTASPLDPFAI
jgi:hypothetical protein